MTILYIVTALIIFGLFMITSASAVVAEQKFGQGLYFVKNQVLKGLIPGLILGYIAFLIPYEKWRQFAKPLFLIGLALMVLVFVPHLGISLGGARRWINIPSINFQPSEIFKILFVIYLASFLQKAQELKGKKHLSNLSAFILVLLLSGGLIALQPDIGTLGIFILTAMAMYFSAFTPPSHIFILGGLGLASLLLLIKIFPHAAQRVQVMLHPELDPGGIGYQLNQGLIALGSGGFFGQGLAQSKQKFLYLPQPGGDSIVAVIGEELGFLGMLILTSLFVAFAIQGLKIARHAPDEFGKLLAVGLTCLIVIQAFINIAAILGLIPLTGLPLPFVSYGGTSLVISLVAVGMLLNISKYSTK